MPHTVEEAYELADAARSGDDERIVDELGDVLFQVYFLSLLLEERGAGDLAEVAERHMAKLVRRHPHVFGDAEIESAEEVVARWSRIKREERGGDLFGEVAETLPSTLYAMRIQKRAARADDAAEDSAGQALARLRDAAADLATAPPAREPDRFERVGELLFEAVAAARALDVDPELSLRRAAADFRERVEASAR